MELSKSHNISSTNLLKKYHKIINKNIIFVTDQCKRAEIKQVTCKMVTTRGRTGLSLCMYIASCTNKVVSEQQKIEHKIRNSWKTLPNPIYYFPGNFSHLFSAMKYASSKNPYEFFILYTT